MRIKDRYSEYKLKNKYGIEFVYSGGKKLVRSSNKKKLPRKLKKYALRYNRMKAINQLFIHQVKMIEAVSGRALLHHNSEVGLGK